MDVLLSVFLEFGQLDSQPSDGHHRLLTPSRNRFDPRQLLIGENTENLRRCLVHFDKPWAVSVTLIIDGWGAHDAPKVSPNRYGTQRVVHLLGVARPGS